MFTKQQVIYLAGGCFWGVEAFISRLKGVNQTEVGYANGRDLAPTYQKVCTGKTGHAETVKITYNPEIISLLEILEKFYQIIDPYSLNRQGGDIGTQYRTGIYWQEDSQGKTVMKFLADKRRNTDAHKGKERRSNRADKGTKDEEFIFFISCCIFFRRIRNDIENAREQ